MKTIACLTTLAALPFCGSLVLRAQDTPVPPPPLPKSPEAAPAPYERSTSVAPVPARPLKVAPPYAVQPGAGVAVRPAPAAATFSDRLQRIIAQAGGPAAGPGHLIIRSSGMEPKEQANLEEDLAVMAHILGKADDGFGGSRPAVAMGIDVFGGQGPAGVRMLYLEGYGALFTLNVGMPLVEPPSPTEEKKDEPRGDSAWDEARRELHGEGPIVPVAVAPVEAYSAEKVSKLTDTLIEALRNATNIRGLKAEDFVTVCVLGAPVAPSRPGKEGHGVATSYGGYGGGYGGVNVAPGAPQNGTILTIRARKSDIDAFAKGKLTADEFRKETRIQRYEDGLATGTPMGFGGGHGGYGGMGGVYGGGNRF